ncbi:MAG: AtpZ/AtpI family protein [Acidobacteria bacterium]|nr:AtpZ/AtpI family protein [Acidobacteriota bacterium]MBI3282430.1 AtpZ/AtpI family protein [Acidobacteriota bacterium]
MRKADSPDAGERERRKNPWVQFGEYSALALALPVSTFAGYLIGYLLDQAFGTNFLYIIFLLLGIAAGLVEVVRKVQRQSKIES